MPPSVTNVNIFDITAKPIVAPSEVDNDESDENEQAIISQQKNFKSEPDVKEMKYEYISEYERLGEFKLRKFREGTKVPKDMVYVTIERHRTHSALVYLFIRTNDTKLVVFHSLLMKNVSKMEHFNGKDYNLKLNVVINKLKQKES